MKIAITGSIGSGKSSLGTYLRQKGFDVVDTDRLVHEFYLSTNILYDPVLDAFGMHILDDSGEIDRQKLGAIVFNDALALNDLESIVFPAVASYIQNYKADLQTVFFEVPMLFESGMNRYFDVVLMVDTDREIALKRLHKRGLSREDALKRLDLQMDPLLKTEKSDVLFYNNGTMAELFIEVDTYLNNLKEESL